MKQLQNTSLNRPDLETYKASTKMSLILILDNVRSGLNVGAIFRSADAFAIHSICLCGITVTPPHPEIMKTALGANESVDWKYFETTLQAIEHVKAAGYKAVAIEQTDQSVSLEKLNEVDFWPMAIIFGNEMRGISEAILKKCDAAIEIPQQGIKHSLNVATSAGIVMWECYKHYYLSSAR